MHARPIHTFTLPNAFTCVQGHYETAQRESDVHDMVALAQEAAGPHEPDTVMRIRLSVTADDYVQVRACWQSCTQSCTYFAHRAYGGTSRLLCHTCAHMAYARARSEES